MQENINYGPLDELTSESTFPEIQAALVPILEAILAIQDRNAQQKACKDLQGTFGRTLEDSAIVLIVQNLYSNEAPNCFDANRGRALLNRKMLNAREIENFLNRFRNPPPLPAPSANAPVQGVLERILGRWRRWRKQ